MKLVDQELLAGPGASASSAQGDQPAPGPSHSPPYACAASKAHCYQLFALARLHPWGAGVWSRPLRDLLLQPGEDELLAGAGQGQGQGQGQAQGQGQGQGQEEGQAQGQGREEGREEGQEEGPQGQEEGAPGQGGGRGEGF